MTPKIVVTQGLFDIIVERAPKMKGRCIDSNETCLYDDGQGNNCFAGMVIQPGLAVERDGRPFEGGIGTLILDLQYRGIAVPEYLTDNEEMLRAMQRIHDDSGMWTKDGPRKEIMSRAFRQVASDYGLKTNTVDEFFPA